MLEAVAAKAGDTAERGVGVRGGNVWIFRFGISADADALLGHGTEHFLHLGDLGITEGGGKALGASVDRPAGPARDLLGLLLAHVLGSVPAEGGDVGRHQMGGNGNPLEELGDRRHLLGR